MNSENLKSEEFEEYDENVIEFDPLLGMSTISLGEDVIRTKFVKRVEDNNIRTEIVEEKKDELKKGNSEGEANKDEKESSPDGWEVIVPSFDPEAEDVKKRRKRKKKTVVEEEEGEVDKDNRRKSVIHVLDFKKRRKVDHILRELLTTERKYVDDLDRVFSKFIDPLKRQTDVHKNQRIISMFAKLDIIRNVNKVFLGDLEKVISMDESNLNRLNVFSTTVLEFFETFKLYSDYVKEFNEFNLEISSMKKSNKMFRTICEAAQYELKSERSRITDLPSFLITPVQRIPRIRLLLRDILEIVESEFDEHENLQEAYLLISDMAKYSNDKTTEMKNIQRLEDLTKELGRDLPVEPHRKLISENVFDRIRKSGKPLPSNFVLLSDLLIVYPLRSPIDLTFTYFKDPYFVNLATPKLKLRMIDETTMNIDFENKDGVLKKIMVGFPDETTAMEYFKSLSRQIKKKRVVV